MSFFFFFNLQGKTKPYVNGTPPAYFREDLKPWEKSPILKTSAPQPIPSNRIDTSSSSSWVAGSFRYDVYFMSYLLLCNKAFVFSQMRILMKHILKYNINFSYNTQKIV